MNTRREFLRISAVATTATLGGCIRGIADKASSDVAWPPPRPSSVPDKEEVPNLAPPTWGEQDLPRAFVYNDLATREAGKVFNSRLNELQQLAKEDYVQISYCDYPLSWNEWSIPVAIAARSVQHHAGRDAFLSFLQRILRDYMPEPYFTKERILDAAETSGAPRDTVKDDTESWRFYSTIQRSKQKGKQMGLNNSVPLAVVVDGDRQSRPVQPTAGRIKIVTESLVQRKDAGISRPQ